MRLTHLALMAGLLIGIYGGASKSAAEANLNNSISGAEIATIGRIAGLTGLQDRINIGNIDYEYAIGRTIFANYINRTSIADSKIFNNSLIAIRTIINADIHSNQIDAAIDITA
jgi:hypothetical protein